MGKNIGTNVLNEVDRKYVRRLVDSCEATYDELPPEVQRALDQIRASGFVSRIHKMETHFVD